MAVEDDDRYGGGPLQLLGRFQVRRGGEEVPPAAFGGRKVRTLLRVLAVRRPDLVPHEALAEALWPDRLPADPAANLGVLVNRARRALGDPALIVTGTGGYALGAVQPSTSTEFLAAIDAPGRPTTTPVRCAARGAALQLWGEPLAEDTYADWAREPRERLHHDSGWSSASAPRARHWRSATRHGRRAGRPTRSRRIRCGSRRCWSWPRRWPRRATRQVRWPAGRAATRLADELGVDPSPAVDALQLALLRGEHQAVRRPSAPAPASSPTFPGRLAGRPSGPPSSAATTSCAG